jgi:hypothetical protein
MDWIPGGTGIPGMERGDDFLIWTGIGPGLLWLALIGFPALIIYQEIRRRRR